MNASEYELTIKELEKIIEIMRNENVEKDERARGLFSQVKVLTVENKYLKLQFRNKPGFHEAFTSTPISSHTQ
jgi:hypothetical protein